MKKKAEKMLKAYLLARNIMFGTQEEIQNMI